MTRTLVAHITHTVRRWRDGEMIVRWVATAVREAERSRKLGSLARVGLAGCAQLNNMGSSRS